MKITRAYLVSRLEELAPAIIHVSSGLDYLEEIRVGPRWFMCTEQLLKLPKVRLHRMLSDFHELLCDDIRLKDRNNGR